MGFVMTGGNKEEYHVLQEDAAFGKVVWAGGVDGEVPLCGSMRAMNVVNQHPCDV